MKQNDSAPARFDVEEFKQKLKNDIEAAEKLRYYMYSILKEKEKFKVDSTEEITLRDKFNRMDAVLKKLEEHQELTNEDKKLLSLTDVDKEKDTGGKRRKTRRNRKSKKTRKSRKNHRKSKRRSRR